jgi:hypothetical protein
LFDWNSETTTHQKDDTLGYLGIFYRKLTLQLEGGNPKHGTSEFEIDDNDAENPCAPGKIGETEFPR